VKEGRQHNNSVDRIGKMKQNKTTESPAVGQNKCWIKQRQHY